MTIALLVAFTTFPAYWLTEKVVMPIYEKLF